MPNRTKIISYLISFSFLTLSFRHEITSICLYLAGIISLIEIIKKKINIIKIKKNTIVIFFISYILIEIIGLFYTENLYFGLKDIESKLLLIIGSLIILANNKKEFNSQNFYKYYIIGIIINLLYLTLEGFIFFNKHQIIPKYLQFSILMHPTYYSFYLVLAIILILEFRDKIINNKLLLILLLIYISIGILLTDSKAGIICYFLTIIFYSTRIILTLKLKMKILISIALIISLFVIMRQSSNSRIMEIFNNLQTSNKFSNYNGIYNSTETRIIIWRSTTQIIKENLLLGTGTGDIKDALKIQFVKNNYSEGINKNYNCHNQFLQILGTFGIVLGIPLIICFFRILYLSIIDKKPYLIFITLIIIINFCLESFLETKAGLELFILYGIITFLEIKWFNPKLS